MNVVQELALLTDDEAERCLNGVIKTFVNGSGNPALQELVASPEALQEAFEQAGATGTALATTSITGARESYKTRKAIRTALVQAAADPALSPRLEAYLTTQRNVLFEPVTTALVLAGIVFSPFNKVQCPL